jgi:hypothetical protein
MRYDGGPAITNYVGDITRNHTAAQTLVGAYDHPTYRYPWDGRIGPLAIWNRVLSTSEQNDIWSYGAGAAYPFPLVNY